MTLTLRSMLLVLFALAASVRGDLARDAQAILHEKCLACHGTDPKKIKGQLDLRTREATLKGGESGPALVSGSPAKSRLYVAVTWNDDDLQMPPKANDRLTEAQVALLARWIEAGAPWPGGEATAVNRDEKDGIEIKTSGGLSGQWTTRRYKKEDLWAYLPPARPAVPLLAQHAVDAFILEKLKQAGLDAAPPADSRTLIRRLTYDLTGLPPTPAEIEAFEKDQSPDAYAKLVERLLASPRYGERMAQHWLDVARYADTDGFSNDFERPNAWRYRDYVIRSFNQELPYDQFILQQIAGDELDSKDPSLAVAVGFLRTGPWEHTAMSVAAVTRQLWLDDVTNSVGQTFLGQGMSCCRCHDHKFDPLPTRDYYSMQAVFASTQFAERSAAFIDGENRAGAEENLARIERLRKDTGLRQIGTSQGDGFKRINKKLDEYLKREAKRDQPLAFSVETRDAEPVRILMGGSLEAPGDTVRPDVLSACKSDVAAQVVPESSQGRRLALAKWIASPGNPLTARVMVNRVWQMHFGAGLVASPNNFGKMGKRPTHPELLDHLANWFVDNGWSIKKLHRLIVSSDAYQRTSEAPADFREQLNQKDPFNHLLAVYPPRRLSAEELRDAMLAVSGELSPDMGGPGIFPEINWEVALQPRHIMGGAAPVYQPSPTPQQRNRRTIYAFRYRTLADPMLEVFNRPGSELSCEMRDQTTIAPQVFALFNGQFVHDRALAIAHKTGGDIPTRCGALFQRVHGRSPSPRELEWALAHVRKLQAHHQANPPVAWNPPDKVIREMIEEQTGELIRWEERLDVMSRYQSDLRPWNVDATTRALAELALVLLNSNEFVYLY